MNRYLDPASEITFRFEIVPIVASPLRPPLTPIFIGERLRTTPACRAVQLRSLQNRQAVHTGRRDPLTALPELREQGDRRIMDVIRVLSGKNFGLENWGEYAIIREEKGVKVEISSPYPLISRDYSGGRLCRFVYLNSYDF